MHTLPTRMQGLVSSCLIKLQALTQTAKNRLISDTMLLQGVSSDTNKGGNTLETVPPGIK